MKRTLVSITSVLILVGVCLLGTTPNLLAGEGCTEASLNGRYGFLFNGVSGAELRPFAAVGVETFDGKGNLSGVASVSRNGEILLARTFQGTYTVNPDCTGADMVVFDDTDNPNPHEFVLVDGGNELRLFSTGGGGNIALYKRINAKECAEANFAGNYGYNGIGKIVSPEPAEIAFMGRMAANGKGYFEGGDTIMRNGELLRRTYTAEYNVRPDCAGSYEADTTLGIVHSDFVIVGDGEELLVLRTDAGQVLTFTFKRQ